MLPADLQTVTVSMGPYLLPTGEPVTGSVAFTPSWPMVHAPSGTTILAAPVKVTLDGQGSAVIVLPASDADGLTRQGVRYTVAPTFGNLPALSSFSVLLPAADPAVDLDLMAPVTGPDGTVVSLPTVTSVAGLSGAVTAPELVGALGVLAADGPGPITLRSPADALADTARLRVISYQKQEPENGNNGGEGIWLDLASPLSKNMLTWRLAFDAVTRLPYPLSRVVTDADMHRIVWAGAHYYAQDQVDDANPTDVHGHWSVEVPDASLALRTRLEVKFVGANNLVGLDRTLVQTASADLVADCSNGQVLRLRTGPGAEKALEFANDEWGTVKRWRVRTTGAESGSNAGADLGFARYNDAGTAVSDEPLAITRSNGRVTIGGATGTSAGLTVLRNSAGNAVTVNMNLAGAAGATAVAVTPLDAASRLLQSNVAAEATARFVAFADGKHEWGPGGSGSRDVNLYRDRADVLKTDDALKVGAYATTARPSAATLGAGAQVFDTTLNRPIWSTGSAWVDAGGVTV